MILLWAILFLAISLALGVFAFSGVAIAISFFTKILFSLSFACLMISLILIIIEKIQAHRKDL
jgi:uncharacterized membrane protein YtjA (UPF0391 family)